MPRDLLARMWRAMPARVRRAGVWLTQPRFTVTAGAVVLDDRDRILLLQHVFRAGSGWGIPGGFVERGEQPEDALRRELREEVGLEAADVRLVSARTLKPTQQVELLFLVRAREGAAARPASGEVRRAEWFGRDQLPPQLSRDQRRLIERALENGRAAGE
ncbi:MAG: NUDIX domain-containing protein [Acidobacteria bacterium]|nr:NUDIX domain-containing protein [Acidobacteriota bacterium]